MAWARLDPTGPNGADAQFLGYSSWMQARYQREAMIGAGAMGVVERHHDLMLGRSVAFKRPQVEGSGRFVEEARVLASLEHPGIPALYSLTPLDEGAPGFTMEPLSGRGLDAVLAESELARGPGPRPSGPRSSGLRRLVTILRDVADIAGFAHTRGGDAGVAHHDLKPANVLVGPRDEVWVVDWGLAAWGEAAAGGTPAWMAPEQARGEPAGPAADVWALGVMLYQVVFGRLPFPEHPLHALREGRAVTPADEDAPPELWALIQACTRPHPRDRPRDGRAVAAILDAWLDGSLARTRGRELVRRARETSVAARARQAAAWDTWRTVQARAPGTAPTDGGRTPGLPDPEHERALVLAERELAEAAVAVEEALELGREALGLDPDLPEARRFLAEHHREQAALAEARFEDAGAHLAALDVWDDGEAAEWRRGRGRLVVDSSPSGVEVWIGPGRGEGVARRLGCTPLEVGLEMGSYRLRLAAPGRDVWVPVRIDRLGTWDVGVVDLTICPPPGFVWVHGGPFLRGDPLRVAACEGFGIAELPVSNLEYDQFLATLPAEEAAARAALPGSPELPVCGVRPADALAYASWWARTAAPGVRLLTALEWEKAARGVDGRLFPWGDEADPARANVVGGPSSTLVPARAHPYDRSVYGVWGLAGGVRDFCRLDETSGRVVSKGGAWSLALERARASIETGATLTGPGPASGFRLGWSPPHVSVMTEEVPKDG